VTYSCNGGVRASAVGSFPRVTDVPAVKRNGSGSTTLTNALPSVSGVGGCTTVCSIDFSGFSAGIVGVNASIVPVADTTLVTGNCP
ncbi:MAG: hypothetical protein ACO3Q7_03145, partial [Steroidobacteraceae bacterium]